MILSSLENYGGRRIRRQMPAGAILPSSTVRLTVHFTLYTKSTALLINDWFLIYSNSVSFGPFLSILQQGRREPGRKPDPDPLESPREELWWFAGSGKLVPLKSINHAVDSRGHVKASTSHLASPARRLCALTILLPHDFYWSIWCRQSWHSHIGLHHRP